jgi:hypothetical protein
LGLALAAAALALSAAAGAAADPPPAGDPKAAFDRAVGDLGLQTDVTPRAATAGPAGASGGGGRGLPFGRLLDLSLPRPVVYALAAIILLAVVAPEAMRLFSRLAARRRRARPEAPAADAAPAIDLGAALDDAEKLAASGRFGEAAHILLLRTIELIAKSRSLSVRPSMTGREVAALAGLSARQRRSVELLVERVEPAWFGGKPATESDWLECRGAHAALAAALSGQPAAA